MKYGTFFKGLLVVILCVGGFSLQAVLGQTVVRGVVIDGNTNKGVPFAAVVFEGTTIGVVTDVEGKYLIRCEPDNCTQVRFQSLGYKTIFRDVNVGEENILNVRLEPSAVQLRSAVVKGKKKKYRNKDNPAVALVREVIARKDSNRVQSHDFVEYEEYEKLQMSLSSVSDKLQKRKLFKKYAFMFENVDTTLIEGKSILPMYLKETITQRYWSRDPEREKRMVKGLKRVSFEEFIDDDGLTTYLTHLYNDIDIYENNILLLTNLFLSPIADGAPTFYEFFITDTVTVDSEPLVELSFIPRNTADFVFQGYMLVSLDGQYTVRKLDMGVNKNINLNWVRELRIDQRFQRDVTGRYPMVYSRMRADFGLSNTGGGIYGERSISLKDLIINKPRTVEFYKEEADPDSLLDVNDRGEEYWSQARHRELSNAESKTYQNIDSLKQMPSFKRTVDIATLLLAGYKGFGWWELGPVNTFYSFNPVEGFRGRIGGRTTPKFSERLNFEGYTAYGFKDKRWKYLIGTTYSLPGYSLWKFPVRAFRASFQRDTKIPGQELQFVQEDFVLLSFKRGINDKWLYNDIWRFEYLHEFENHTSFRFQYLNWEQAAAGGLNFFLSDINLDPTAVQQLVRTSEASLELRIAPNEKFFQGKTNRIPIANKHPIITLRASQGLRDVWQGEYNYTNLRLNVYKRVYLSQFGYADVTLEGGYLEGQVPFPLLTIHRANQTFSYQLQSYNLMNFLEFVSDEYASVNIGYFLNGALFNKIPLLKKLKWREVATFKAIYGGLRDENRPELDSTLLRFPTDAFGSTTTFALDDGPYIEGSVGIANIFKLFRVDLVRRFTYLDNPSVAEWGVRGRFKLDF